MGVVLLLYRILLSVDKLLVRLEQAETSFLFIYLKSPVPALLFSVSCKQKEMSIKRDLAQSFLLKQDSSLLTDGLVCLSFFTVYYM